MKTERGFERIEFEDCYHQQCVLQESSSALQRCLWLGLAKAEPVIMKSDAKKLGVEGEAVSGFVPYPIPEQVHISSQMHLNREQVYDLVAKLHKWLEYGSLN